MDWDDEDRLRNDVEAEEPFWHAVCHWRSKLRTSKDSPLFAQDPLLKKAPGDISYGAGEKITLLKKAQYLIDDSQGLGICFRLRMAYLASRLRSQREFARKCQIKPQRFLENLQYGSSRWYTDIWQPVARYAAHDIRQGEKKFTVNEFRNTPFHGHRR